MMVEEGLYLWYELSEEKKKKAIDYAFWEVSDPSEGTFDQRGGSAPVRLRIDLWEECSKTPLSHNISLSVIIPNSYVGTAVCISPWNSKHGT